MSSILHVYDFDGTLFRETSMSWIEPMVQQAKRSLANPHVYSVILTGRPGPLLRSRTQQQLLSRGLNFNELIMASSLFGTAKFKAQQVQRLVRERRPSYVEIWDDKLENLEAVAKVLGRMGVSSRLNHVEV